MPLFRVPIPCCSSQTCLLLPQLWQLFESLWLIIPTSEICRPVPPNWHCSWHSLRAFLPGVLSRGDSLRSSVEVPSSRKQTNKQTKKVDFCQTSRSTNCLEPSQIKDSSTGDPRTIKTGHSVGHKSLKIFTSSLEHGIFPFPFLAYSVTCQIHPHCNPLGARDGKAETLLLQVSLSSEDWDPLGPQLNISRMSFRAPLLGDPQRVCQNIGPIWQNIKIPLGHGQLKHSMLYSLCYIPTFSSVLSCRLYHLVTS